MTDTRQSPASAIGRTIGTYRILEELGRGGMGVLYVAEDLRLGRTVAIKALPGHLTRDEESRERLRREARAAAALVHPGIATVFALEEHGDELFIVAEYIRGRTLRQVLESGPVPASEVREIAVDIARALAAAHRAGVVHRDLKPENIMRPDEGGVKVLDFGLTRTGVATGTPTYMSPEQLEGGTVDFRTDLFSFGIVLYELATGIHPFTHGSAAGTLEPQLSADYVPLTAWPDADVRRLERIVEHCLRKDPGERFESTAALVLALERLESGRRWSWTGFPWHRTGPPARPVLAPTPASSSSMPPVFGRYEIRRVVGSGGFGTVYLGHDPQLARDVAIKVLRSGNPASAGEERLLLHEARRAGQLRHPGIVTVHDVGVQGGQVYIVSDFLEGPTLAEYLAQHRFAWDEAARLTAAVADALAHAHARRTIHRDIKPGNIIVTASSIPVLVDFGLGLDETKAGGGGELGMVSGTVAYMSPEQVSGRAHRIDGRTDIYSLGIVLYEMLCGLVPFRSEITTELVRQVRDDDPQPLRQLRHDVPPELERICLKAVAKRMEDRYGAAEDFAEDLRRLLPVERSALSLPSPQDLVADPMTESAGVRRASSRATPSSSGRGMRDAERRHVTVLVCGSTSFASDAFIAQIDAEDRADVLKQFRGVCEEAIGRFDGASVEWSGNRLLACFGYPVAHEDDACRAAHAALRVRTESADIDRELRRRYNLELQPWAIIHTGAAVTEMQDGSIFIVGEARDVADRLGTIAPPGQVMCSASTERLLKGFESNKIGIKRLPEISEAVELFSVDGLRHAASVTDPAPSPLTPLTGRDQELSLLVERWEQAREGMGQTVLLVGEPGLGKSRLVDTLKVRVQGNLHGDEDSAIVEWRCSPLYQNSSLYPAIAFYERLLAFDGFVSPQDRFERLLRHLQRYGLARPDVVPLFASLLSLPQDERFPSLRLSPIREKDETLRVLREWLRAYSSTRPALFIVEDLHWIDPSTLQFLSEFVAEDVQDSVLTLLTFRPEFKTPWPSVSHQTGLALNRLTRRQVGDMMRQTTGDQRLADAFINEVYDRTSGVPLFVEEFTKMAGESGLLNDVSDDSGRTRALLAREIPASLQDLVMARLDRMEGNRDVVQLASTIGREFSYDLMAAAATVDEPTLQDELRKLVDADILYQKGRPPRCGYIFKHALLEEAAYNSLVKSKRQQFHRRIAEVLEAQFPQTVETQPEVLAHHFTDAGVTEKAIAYWLKAGLRSQGRSANVEAIAHLTQGLAILTLLPVSRAHEAMEIQFLNALGTAYISTRGYGASEVGPIFARARALCQQIGEPRQLFAIIWGSWAWSLVRGDVRGSLELAGEGMELAARVADPGMLMEALFLPAATEFFRGDFRAAHECSARALADYDDRDRIDVWRAHTGEDSGVAHRAYHALALWHLGFPDQAVAMSRETVALARDVGHQFTLAFALEHAAWLYQHCRLGAEALSCAEEEIAIAAAEGFAYWHASGTAFKAGAMLLEGRADDAVTSLGGAMKALTSTGSEIGNPCRFSILGDACMQRGQYQDAHKALDQGLAVVEKNDDRCYEAELHRLQGELWLAESPEHAKRAEDCFRLAIDVSRRQQSRAWELRSVMSLARLWTGQQRADDARQALAAVYDIFNEGFTTPDLTEATLFMAKLR